MAARSPIVIAMFKEKNEVERVAIVTALIERTDRFGCWAGGGRPHFTADPYLASVKIFFLAVS